MNSYLTFQRKSQGQKFGLGLGRDFQIPTPSFTRPRQAADALLTQRKIATYLVQERKAHYHFTVKGNQPTLLEDIKLAFEARREPDFVDCAPPAASTKIVCKCLLRFFEIGPRRLLPADSF